MFNGQERTKEVHAHVELSTGRILDGKFIIAETSDLLRTLNGDGKFAVFIDHEGNHKLIAKSSIVEAKERRPVQVKSLDAGNDNGFDPYKILGVTHEASFDVIKVRYLDLARRYHPGRYAHKEMPAEIAQYALEKSRVIEQAYEALRTGSDHRAAG